MNTKNKRLYSLSVIVLLILGGLTGCKDVPANEQSITENALEQESAKGKNPNTIPFDDAESFFEFNTTDNDLGLQIFLDTEGWEQVRVDDANGKRIVQVLTKGPLKELGITELRFESAEPSPEEVLAMFPPGEYLFTGKTVEGDRLSSSSELSHDFLAAPTISPSDGEEVDPENTVVSWDAPGAELVEIIIESEDSDNVFDVIVEGDVTSLTIPSEFLEAGLEYKLEILAIAENGNRTILETTFRTSDV